MRSFENTLAIRENALSALVVFGPRRNMPPAQADQTGRVQAGAPEDDRARRKAIVLVRRAFSLAGFDVRLTAGTSFVITASRETFERLFACDVSVDDFGVATVLARRFVATLTLPLNGLPRPIRQWIDSVTFLMPETMPNRAPLVVDARCSNGLA